MASAKLLVPTNGRIERKGRASLALRLAANAFTREGRIENRVLWNLFSEDLAVLKRAIINAGVGRVKRALPLLHALLNHEDAPARTLAVKAVANIGEEHSTLFLLARLLLERDGLARRELVQTLGKFAVQLGDKKIEARQVENAGLARERIKRTLEESGCSETVGQLGEQQVPKLTYKQLISTYFMITARNSRDDCFARSYAIEALGELNAREAERIIREVALDRNEKMNVRNAAIKVMIDWRDDAFKMKMQTRVDDGEEGERRLARIIEGLS